MFTFMLLHLFGVIHTNTTVTKPSVYGFALVYAAAHADAVVGSPQNLLKQTLICVLCFFYSVAEIYIMYERNTLISLGKQSTVK